MPRMARAVLVGVAHHLTQRGVSRQQVFFDERDYQVYLAQVCSAAGRFGLDLLGYCLMPNHVHWVVVPHHPEALARVFGEAHGRYASYCNARLTRSGHFWQNRYFSCALDNPHLWAALRYVERNPVRAGLASRAGEFRWSSAAAHTGEGAAPEWLAREPMRSTFTTRQWEMYIGLEKGGAEETTLLGNTYTGRPAGSAAFVEWAESSLGRRLAARPGGRPPKILAAKAVCVGEQVAPFDK